MSEAITIPAAEWHALQKRLQQTEQACSELQLWLVLAMHETGRARYTASEIARVKSQPWNITPVEDKETGAWVVNVTAVAAPPQQAPGQIRTVPRLAVVK